MQITRYSEAWHNEIKRFVLDLHTLNLIIMIKMCRLHVYALYTKNYIQIVL